MREPRATFFDFETGALEPDQLAEVQPEFKAARNLRDPIKIAADIEAKREAWYADAALSATTGRILATGRLSAGDLKISTGDERDLLEEFWADWREGGRFIGFNCCRFDLPFAIRRSFVHALTVPPDVRAGRYWSAAVIDLREAWQCGDWQAEGSLDSIARAFGLGGKSGNGADFANLLKTNPAEALEYLGNDLYLTRSIAERMNLA
jgi:hypothetical protein